MTPENQRIAIAKACGWKHCCVTRLDCIDRFWGIKPGAEYRKTSDVPDYLNDLNAMHEAENIMTASQRREYERQLLATGRLKDRLWEKTAAQRAEAFLRTLGLWEGRTNDV